jgi:hypothetical protein
MVDKPSRRAVTVMETMERILDILKDRNQHELLQALLQNVELETLVKYKIQGGVPKWYLDLFVALTQLYDQGYLDSTKNSVLGR